MTLCKLPNERMNWVCEGTDLWAFQDDKGLYMILSDGVPKPVVIRRDLLHSLCQHNRSFALLAKNGLREFIEGPHVHAVWDDGMRGLKL